MGGWWPHDMEKKPQKRRENPPYWVCWIESSRYNIFGVFMKGVPPCMGYNGKSNSDGWFRGTPCQETSVCFQMRTVHGRNETLSSICKNYQEWTNKNATSTQKNDRMQGLLDHWIFAYPMFRQTQVLSSGNHNKMHVPLRDCPYHWFLVIKKMYVWLHRRWWVLGLP